jgi:hypothetical protein
MVFLTREKKPGLLGVSFTGGAGGLYFGGGELVPAGPKPTLDFTRARKPDFFVSVTGGSGVGWAVFALARVFPGLAAAGGSAGAGRAAVFLEFLAAAAGGAGAGGGAFFPNGFNFCKNPALGGGGPITLADAVGGVLGEGAAIATPDRAKLTQQAKGAMIRRRGGADFMADYGLSSFTYSEEIHLKTYSFAHFLKKVSGLAGALPRSNGWR